MVVDETIPIERIQVNVINLSNGFDDSSPGPRHYTFVLNFLDVPTTCVVFSISPLTIPIANESIHD
jgi:hypothetical protein